MANLAGLYQQMILDHNRRPLNFRVIEGALKSEGYNPLCGDHLFIYLKRDADGGVEDVAFQGSGCAICKASASLMTESVKGKSVAAAKDLAQEFLDLLRGDLDPEKDKNTLGKLKVFAGVWQYPARIKCAGLAWRTLEGALSNDVSTVTTEESP